MREGIVVDKPPGMTPQPPTVILTQSGSPVGQAMPRSGIVVVDKPAGMTSQQVVGRIKHRLAAQWGMRPKTLKVGHAGTLDPMATGVLVVGVGKATKVLGQISGHDKCYEATIRLGQATTTDDAEGEPIVILPASPVILPKAGPPQDLIPTVILPKAGPQQAAPQAHLLDQHAVQMAMAELTGDIEQVPSSVSAIKVDGRRAYALVRAGQTVELKPRPVHVARFDAVALRVAPPFLDVDVVVECSSGTYVRALARDLGNRLGVGGHVTALRRTRVGTFGIDQAVQLDDVAPAVILPPPDVILPLSTVILPQAGPQQAGPQALALGTFDGVHLGHRAVLAAARDAVGDDGVVTAVTFWPHPMTVFAPDSAPPLLQGLDAREDALLEASADEVLVIAFTPALAALTPEEFVERILAPMAPAAVAVGPGFTFGVRASGNPARLAELAAGRFDVVTAPLVSIDGRTVSSTAIRAALTQGDVALANHLLGRDFAVRGVVVHGDKRGRTLGFPTANLAPDSTIATPADGVYAGWLRRLDDPLADAMPAAVSVGDNPTFRSTRRVEAHVLDVDIELYDVPVEIGFTRRLRGMVKFNGVDELIAQMHQDVAQTRGAI